MTFYFIVSVIFFFIFILRASSTSEQFLALVRGIGWPVTVTLGLYKGLKIIFSDEDFEEPTLIEQVIVVVVVAAFMAYYFFG